MPTGVYKRKIVKTLEDRFWEKVEKTESCWIWTASTMGTGYGYIGLTQSTRHISAHILSYRIHKGEVPEGLELDHLCRNKRCVNPEHLEPVTHKVNTLRGMSPSAVNARKTHCPKGHEYNEENTYHGRRGDGSRFRQCRICVKLRYNNSD